MSPGLFLFSRGEVRMDPDPGGEQEWEWGAGGPEVNGVAANAKEKVAARSFVSFSSEKETKEPWPPPLLYL